MAQCLNPGCGREAAKRGYCDTHYHYRWDHGLPMPVSRALQTMTFEERFWKRVAKSDGCWLWTGHRNRRGYGRIKDGARDGALAHRASWKIHNGPIPAGMCICHRCDNPPCVNPAHLFLGTIQDNVADMDAKGRRYLPPKRPPRPGPGQPRGSRSPHAKLTEADVVAMREERATGATFASIARRYGVDVAAAWRAITRKRWAHVP